MPGMADLVVPELGESITEAVVAKWLKRAGDAVENGEAVAQRVAARETGALPAAAEVRSPKSEVQDSDRLSKVDPRDQVVLMSTLRKRVAERLVQAQHEAASLTTFNEVDMSAIIELRARYKD